jgi:hypothetical protein
VCAAHGRRFRGYGMLGLHLPDRCRQICGTAGFNIDLLESEMYDSVVNLQDRWVLSCTGLTVAVLDSTTRGWCRDAGFSGE